VVLAHDIHGPTVRAMPAAVSGLHARGFRFVTVSELIGWPRWDRGACGHGARSAERLGHAPGDAVFRGLAMSAEVD
jgi:hypothetical protein